MPSGWTGSLNNSISAYGFLSTLHHAMVDDGDYCFAMSNTGPCIEFCTQDALDEHWQRQPQGSRRKNGEWLDWSVDKFITEIESYHIAKNLERERLEQQRQEFLARFQEHLDILPDLKDGDSRESLLQLSGATNLLRL